MIYLDNVAGTKVDERVVNKMLPFITEKYGNPSAHFYPLGRESYEAVFDARKNVAALINAKPEEVIFTSCGTESNNLAIRGAARSWKYNEKKHIIISEVEHFSVQNVCMKLKNDGYRVTVLKVDNNGKVNPDDVKKYISKDTLLVSVINGSPEIGTIQDTSSIGKICKENGVLFHVDAVASAGHVNLNVDDFNCDMLSLSGQNFYGPKGAAALYIREGVKLAPLFDGGSQEFGMRSGSENVPAIVGFGEAARIALSEMGDYSAKMKRNGKKLWDGIGAMYDFLHFTGHPEERIPGHVSFWIEYIEGESLLLWYSLNGIFGASGSACSSNILAEDEEDLEASHVLTAIGVPNDICAGSITFSMSKYIEDADIDKVLEVTPNIVDKLCDMSPYFKRGK